MNHPRISRVGWGCRAESCLHQGFPYFQAACLESTCGSSAMKAWISLKRKFKNTVNHQRKTNTFQWGRREFLTWLSAALPSHGCRPGAHKGCGSTGTKRPLREVISSSQCDHICMYSENWQRNCNSSYVGLLRKRCLGGKPLPLQWGGPVSDVPRGGGGGWWGSAGLLVQGCRSSWP